MAVFDTEDTVRQKRARAEQAVSFAAKGRWEDAARVNREILDLTPDDVDALNRLGKALMELGRNAEAREAYGQSLKRDPMNSIAQKNLQRLQKLADEDTTGAGGGPTALDPRLFIEESGKTVVTQLTAVPKSDTIARLAAGEQLQLDVQGARIVVTDLAGQQVGRIEPKLEQDLLKLLQLGNQYTIFVTAAGEHGVSVIIRETFRSAGMGNRPSFRPSAVPEGGFRSYAREGMLRYDEEEDDDDDEDEDEEGEADAGAVAVDADTEPSAPAEGVEVTPLEALVAEEDATEDSEEPT